MNLFMLGWSPSVKVDTRPAEAALRGLVARLPFLDAADLEIWCAPSGAAALVSVAHRLEQTGGVRYVHREEDRVTLFSGRPFCWTGDTETDGRAPLDPRFYLAPVEDWMEVLDGRAVAARYDDATRTLDLWTDPLGSYPVFATECDGVRWISNNAEALRALRGSDAQEPSVLASFLGGGYPIGGEPRWVGVKRLPRGIVHHYRPHTPDARTELLPVQRIAALFGTGWDPQKAAEILVATLRGLADWPGRPNVVAVTGGRDSRLILAAALQAGFDFTGITGGTEEHPDVVIGRLLCRTVGIQHELLHETIYSHPERVAQVVALSSSGTLSVGVDRYQAISPSEGPLLLWHTGQGGEIARGIHGHGEGLDRDGLVRHVMHMFLSPRPWRPTLLSTEGQALVEEQVRGWIDEKLAAGVAPVDMMDMWHILEKTGTWAGQQQGSAEWVMDKDSPFWSARLLPHAVGAPASKRALELFHQRLLEILAPELVNLPFGHEYESRVSGWPALQSQRRRRVEDALRFAGKIAKVAGELRRLGPHPLAPPHPLEHTLALVRERVLEQREHPAWAVLDARRVERLLNRNPHSFGAMHYVQVWSLASIFLTDDRLTS